MRNKKTKLKAFPFLFFPGLVSVPQPWILYLLPSSGTGGWRLGVYQPITAPPCHCFLLTLFPCSPFHRIQSFMSCSNEAPSHWAQSFSNRLFQHEFWAAAPPENLLLHGASTCCTLLLTHPAWSPAGLHIDLCSSTDLHGLQEDSLLHHAPLQGAAGELLF